MWAWWNSEHTHRQKCLHYVHMHLRAWACIDTHTNVQIAHACALTHAHKTKTCFFFFSTLSSFTQRESCRSIVSIMLILLRSSSPDHISINLEQTQGSMRPELCWNQARGFHHHHQTGSLIICHAWWATLIITLQTGLQSTDQMATLIWSHT